MFTGRGLGASTALGIVMLLALAFPASAQQPSPVVVKPMPEDATVAVHTSQNAPLSAVLDEFCRQTHSECEGTAAAVNIELAPMNALGTWAQVIAKLMEGVDLNYAAMPATAVSSARLLITGRALSVKAPQPASAPNDAARSDGRPGPSSSRSFNPNGAGAIPDVSIPQQVAAAEDGAAEAAPPQEPIPSAAAADSASSDSAASPPAGNINLGAATDFMGNPVPPYSGPAYSPFPDGNGRLIPAGNQPITSSPFPDSNGNLIPVSKPVIPQGNPFPPELQGQPE